MLHLAPRLQSAQEQRAAGGVDGPDLTRITRFAALLTEEQFGPQGEVPLHLRTLRQKGLPPFYLERLLNQLERSAWHSSWRDFYAGKANGASRQESAVVPFGPEGMGLGDSQRRARLLLDAAGDALRPLSWQEKTPSPNGSPPGPLDQPSRRDVFQAALGAGGRLANLIASNVIDPIRADTHVPGDPFVQTTLYVVAPLYEPLTSALIWPTLTHLVEYLGQRHVSQVVGIFATGSYATDSTRVVEDAACYAALSELEALTGLRSAYFDDFLADWPEQAGPAQEWLGRGLFDRIYLVDREKSNQGLARSSYELSVLVGNALQALITADGAAFVDEQLGIDLRNGAERPYSLLGAAADYVPLDYIFQAVQGQEEKRLLREQILTGPEEPDAPATLQELGATPPQVLGQLIAQMPGLFEEVAPQSVHQLSVHPDYILPHAAALKMRGLDPLGWLTAFDEQYRSVLGRFEQALGSSALDAAWGLDALREDGLPHDRRDERFLPATSRQMREYLLSLLSAQPSGLLHVRRQLRQWLAELEEQRRMLSVEFLPGERRLTHAERQLEERDWRARYLRAIGDQPALSGSLARALLVVAAVVAVGLLHFFAFRPPVNLEINGATLLGLTVGSLLGAVLAYRARLRRVQKLRKERVALARLELTARLQGRVRHGLARVYDYLEQMLRQMAHALEDTHEELREWSVSAGVPPLPPEGAVSSHLYRPHLNRKMWERCQSFLRSRRDPKGQRGEERLREIWASLPRRRRLAALLAGESAEAQPLEEALFDYFRDSVRSAVSSLNEAAGNSARPALIRMLARQYNLEHLLWRDALPAPGAASGFDAGQKFSTDPATVLRYLDGIWNSAKPAANYDVSEQLASHGLPVEFAAVSGRADSDLTEVVLQELRVARLLTGDPFQITFVRTVHGLELRDLGSVLRYREEMNRLSAGQRALLLLDDSLYRGRVGQREEPETAWG